MKMCTETPFQKRFRTRQLHQNCTSNCAELRKQENNKLQEEHGLSTIPPPPAKKPQRKLPVFATIPSANQFFHIIHKRNTVSQKAGITITIFKEPNDLRYLHILFSLPWSTGDDFINSENHLSSLSGREQNGLLDFECFRDSPLCHIPYLP